MSFSFKTPEESPGFLLWQLTNHWQRLQRQALKKLGITHPQFVVLANLLWFNNHVNNPITQQHIAVHANMDKMMVSDLISTLINKKLISRKEHQLDKRAKSLQLTIKGKALVMKALPIVESIDKAFFIAHKSHIHQLKAATDRL